MTTASFLASKSRNSTGVIRRTPSANCGGAVGRLPVDAVDGGFCSAELHAVSTSPPKIMIATKLRIGRINYPPINALIGLFTAANFLCPHTFVNHVWPLRRSKMFIDASGLERGAP